LSKQRLKTPLGVNRNPPPRWTSTGGPAQVEQQVEQAESEQGGKWSGKYNNLVK